MLRNITVALMLLVLLSLAALVNATEGTQRYTSTSKQAQLVELYTSQGCSSCPPADTWLSKYRSSPGLWRSVVPVAYHVDYWDYLGWRDPFAKAAHSSRQRKTARRADSGVYTPGVFRNQQEWRSWRRPNSWLTNALTGNAEAEKEVGILSGELAANSLKIRFTPHSNLDLSSVKVEAAALRSGQSTEVRAGENRGRLLEHNFVAGQVQKSKLIWKDGAWEGELDPKLSANSSALAFWVLDSKGNYLQATGGWLAD